MSVIIYGKRVKKKTFDFYIPEFVDKSIMI